MKIRQLTSVILLVFVSLLTHAGITGTNPVTTVANMASGALTAFTDLANQLDRASPQIPQGPGLGNHSFKKEELFKPLYMVRDSEGGDVPNKYKTAKRFGTNVGLMLNGYFVTMFTPDSGGGPGGFLVYDVSDPQKIKLKKKIYEPEGKTSQFRESHAIGTSTIKGKVYVVVPSITGIEFWDFTDIEDIKPTKRLELKGVNAGDYFDVSWQLWWQAPYVYVASSDDGIHIIDASDPANPKYADRGQGRPNPVPTSELGSFNVGPIFTMGNHMVITSMEATDKGISSLDISDPLNPRLLATKGALPFYYATCFDGVKVHGSMRNDGAKMHTLDISDRNNIVLENSALVINQQLYCATQDDYVMQGAQHYIHKIDVRDPKNYKEVGSGSLFEDKTERDHSDHGQVTFLGNLVYVGNDHGNGSGFMPHATGPDTTAPKVRQISPRADEKNTALTTRIGIALTDNIRPETVNAQNFIVRVKPPKPSVGESPAIEGFYSAQLGIINFSPKEPLKLETTYEVVLRKGGLKDYAGNALVEDYTFSFTTRSAVDAGMVNHWPLNGSLDDTIGKNNGIPTNGQDVYGRIGMDFSSRAGGIPLQSDSAATTLGGTASVSFYMKTSQKGVDSQWLAPGIFGRDQAAADNDVFWGWIDGKGDLRLTVGNHSQTNPGVKSGSPINDGKWHHVIMTRDSSSGAMTMFVDGTKFTGSGVKGAMGLQNKFKFLGQLQDSPDWFKGELADVRVYDRVLTDAEVKKMNEQVVIGQLGMKPVLYGNEVAFDPPLMGGKGAQYSWRFDDGQSTPFSSDPKYTRLFNRPGHYSVILTVKQSDGVEVRYSFVLAVTAPLTANAPVHSTNITGRGAYIYSVNSDSGTVAAVDARDPRKLVKKWETRVGEEPRTVAVGPDGRVWVAVQGEDKLVALDAVTGAVSTTVALDYGSGPHSVVFAPGGVMGLLTLESKSKLISFDPTTGERRSSLDLPPGGGRGIAVTGDARTAYVTRFKSKRSGGELYEVDLAGMNTRRTIVLRVDTATVDTEAGARGVPNYLHQVVISPDGLRAVLPSKKDNILRGQCRDGRKLDHDKTVRSVLNQVDLAKGEDLPASQIDFDNQPPSRAAVFSPLGDFVFVAQMEGNTVTVADAYSGSRGAQITRMRSTPHGLYIDAERKLLFTNNFLDRSVSAYDVSTIYSGKNADAPLLHYVSTVATEPLKASVLRGKKLFYNASDIRMSNESYISCASCHVDGGDDGMVWDFTQRGEGMRRTISLLGRAGLGHGNLHWSANFDEVQDFENDIRREFGGDGFMTRADFEVTADPLGARKAGKSPELDDLAAYLASLDKYMRSPVRNADGALSVTALQGKKLFGDLQCITCHSGLAMRDGQRHDVGTIQPSSGKGSGKKLAGAGFDTPTLHGIWSNASSFHNGQKATTKDLIVSGHGNSNAPNLSPADSDALVEYLRSLDGPKDDASVGSTAPPSSSPTSTAAQ
ncbi:MULTISPECIES: LamG-like jellyroll fold domain-containing protein [unclassified Variovorax]|uniref:LamG-like jellyroll fold domain-containing protein n=1 Tax=unclassified Variovorax TaxID=663243 RepID=UPI003ECE80A0